jgi:hypothetical protein
VNVIQVWVGAGFKVLGRILQSFWTEDYKHSRCSMLVELVFSNKSLRYLFWVYVVGMGFPIIGFVMWGGV